MDCYNFDEAERWFSEALTVCQIHHYQIGLASSLALLGQLRLYQGQFKAGVDYVRQSVTIYREIEEWPLLSFELANLTVALLSAGDVAGAEKAIEEALTLAEEMQVDRELPFVIQCQAQLHLYCERYGKARALADEAIALAPKAGFRRLPAILSRWPKYGSRMYRKSNVLARAHGVLGWTALAEDRYAEAIDALRESLAGFRTLRNREYEAWSLAGLCAAVYAQGDRPEAQAYLLRALEIAVEIRAFNPLQHLTPILAVLLADADAQSQKERAIELYALAKTQPLVAKSPLFEDITGKYIAATIADLSPDAVEAAQARGRELDWWETAERLLVELREMGWPNASDP